MEKYLQAGSPPTPSALDDMKLTAALRAVDEEVVAGSDDRNQTPPRTCEQVRYALISFCLLLRSPGQAQDRPTYARVAATSACVSMSSRKLLRGTIAAPSRLPLARPLINLSFFIRLPFSYFAILISTPFAHRFRLAADTEPREKSSDAFGNVSCK